MLTQFKRTVEHKVLRDTVHGYINVDYQIIWDLINTPELQRLRRIHQLGGTLQVYHTAEHSRFGHSLGVYEIARLMIENVQDLKQSLSEYDQVALLCAALLHDVGHGPFSHSFESVTGIDHEHMTRRILLEDTEINEILKTISDDFPQDVADIIAHEYKNPILAQIISSQMDADRMDYLLRDSYFTGVSYGDFDLHRILRTLRVFNNVIAIKESGIHAVEDYIMARYQMYWQVYLHPISRSYEAILQSIFKRMRDLFEEDKDKLQCADFFIPVLEAGEIDIQDYLFLDESVCMTGFKLLNKGDDPILKDLTRRLLNRDLFDYHDKKDTVVVEKIEKALAQQGFDPRYYYASDHLVQSLYKPYKANEDASVSILKDEKLVELSQISIIVRGFVRSEEKEDSKVFYPKELKLDE